MVGGADFDVGRPEAEIGMTSLGDNVNACSSADACTTALMRAKHLQCTHVCSNRLRMEDTISSLTMYFDLAAGSTKSIGHKITPLELPFGKLPTSDV